MHDDDLVLSHERRMTTLETTVQTQGRILEGICTKLDSVVQSSTAMKNWVIGGIAVLVLQQVGVVEGLKFLTMKLIGG